MSAPAPLLRRRQCRYKGCSYTACSGIVLQNRKTIGILFEKDGYRKIVYQNISLPY
ncbi:hypothetical protein [Niabella sp.]|uniref:hypothetical protein n=1 Tax=Niabella sp. TaxID=1962976 RepID=UPI0026140D09|nr:hypothetical protein [Niabella sp.]